MVDFLVVTAEVTRDVFIVTLCLAYSGFILLVFEDVRGFHIMMRVNQALVFAYTIGVLIAYATAS